MSFLIVRPVNINQVLLVIPVQLVIDVRVIIIDMLADMVIIPVAVQAVVRDVRQELITVQPLRVPVLLFVRHVHPEPIQPDLLPVVRQTRRQDVQKSQSEITDVYRVLMVITEVRAIIAVMKELHVFR